MFKKAKEAMDEIVDFIKMQFRQNLE